jgi:hypothetical protein
MAAAVMSAIKKQNNEERQQMRQLERKMRKAFDDVDFDDSGKLSVEELMYALQRTGMYDPEDEAAGVKIRKRVHRWAGSDGEYSFKQFKALVDELAEVLGTMSDWQQPVDWLPYNIHARHVYKSKSVTLGVALTIVANFAMIIVQNDTDPYAPEHQRHRAVWRAVDSTCNVIFLLELLLNMYAHFWRPFVVDGWNYLDTAVVIVGVLSLAEVELGPLAQLKMLRALRSARQTTRPVLAPAAAVARTHPAPRSTWRGRARGHVTCTCTCTT